MCAAAENRSLQGRWLALRSRGGASAKLRCRRALLDPDEGVFEGCDHHDGLHRVPQGGIDEPTRHRPTPAPRDADGGRCR